MAQFHSPTDETTHNPQAGSPLPKRPAPPLSSQRSASYTLGLFFIVAVALIWAISSILVQFIYCDMNFDSPFFLTFMSTSLFIVYLPIYFGREAYLSRGKGSETSTILYQDVNSFDNNEDNNNDDDMLSIAAGDSSSSPIDLPPMRLTRAEHFKIACYLAPLWFTANFLYNISLSMTSVTSSTIMSTTGSLFTFGFSLCFVDGERFRWIRFIGVLLCFGGSVLVGLSDSDPPTDGGDDISPGGDPTDDDLTSDRPHQCGGFVDPAEAEGPSRTTVGDFVGLCGAAGYGAYTVMLRLKVPSDEQVSMTLLFGYIGLVNICAIGPILIALYASNSIDLSALSMAVFGMLVLKGAADDVVSDYLWARSVVLTSPTVATVGLGLTIPFAFVSDFLINGIKPTFLECSGAVGVIAGFVLVNL